MNKKQIGVIAVLRRELCGKVALHERAIKARVRRSVEGYGLRVKFAPISVTGGEQCLSITFNGEKEMLVRYVPSNAPKIDVDEAAALRDCNTITQIGNMQAWAVPLGRYVVLVSYRTVIGVYNGAKCRLYLRANAYDFSSTTSSHITAFKSVVGNIDRIIFVEKL
nr:MAG TPA: hypothetical protein [Caudoviricetes sp.]